jgi:hypothetical protein
MTNVIKVWIWSLSVLLRSGWTLLMLAGALAIWTFGAYEWLGLPESSGLLLAVALVWAIVQIAFALMVFSGSVWRAAETAAAADILGAAPPLRPLWLRDRQIGFKTLLVLAVASLLALIVSGVFGWINRHSVDVASFLSFHAQQPFSHVLLEEVYAVIEAVVWITLAGFMLSFLIVLMRRGWPAAWAQLGSLIARSAYGKASLTNLVSVGIFGGAAYGLTVWHPMTPPGFWDYAQLIVRMILVLLLLAAGWMFWLLSLARVHMPPPDTTGVPDTIPAFLP